ncbi:NADH:ubiquinone oxidoreductase [Coemansia sp. RSA 989]|nr:NADH:ubiquinone oxidoreductase [Coemansia sp. RSA 1086]KAJ1750336.1 NADH:ubiquinone oxidoreductase [Coemansia sp. RSA 1821]KAJ1864919.1 NADH:ubiquinone oxidoreductase [Coemansia sp. RSA 989]KAJ1873205.1 NADH:ubiquinone oxidoreductase [Coemansia sp. RSA 990]KAJ2649392.1 NADH:ubiquinone oxidoreductase [Coemansia sp. RSA 1250]KAJ2672246.1 NADH:ubiquinone oxidoreductase [Coemansia sp. RSA 1085]
MFKAAPATGLRMLRAPSGTARINAPMFKFHAHTLAPKKTLVLLGTGWGTTTILKNLDTKHYNVVVVSPRNYFLFTPLLPSCTVGTTESRSIMEPIRHIVGRRGKDMRFYEAECTDIDMSRKELLLTRTLEGADTQSTLRINYDHLVVGVGGTYNTFGTPGVEKHACFLKEMNDASKIRRRLKDAIEKASFGELTSEERDRLLHVVVVGGGPTGVEFAGEVHDLVTEDLAKWVPHLSDKIKITLIEALPRILPAFDERLAQYTQMTFAKNGIQLRTSTRVKEVTDRVLKVESGGAEAEIPYGTIVWAAGIRARQFAHTLRAKVPEVQTSARGLIIDDFLRVQGTSDIWALGDCTVSKNAPLAQVASQQGKWLARALNDLAASEGAFSAIETRKPFTYASNGSLAYIGGERAVAELPWFNRQIALGGPFASVFWKAYCLWELSSVRSSLSVATDWAKRALFGRTMSVD